MDEEAANTAKAHFELWDKVMISVRGPRRRENQEETANRKQVRKKADPRQRRVGDG
jgi:hypothetical protein